MLRRQEVHVARYRSDYTPTCRQNSPDLVEECTQFLWRDLYPRNACRALEFARLFEEPVLLEKALHVITNQTLEVTV